MALFCPLYKSDFISHITYTHKCILIKQRMCIWCSNRNRVSNGWDLLNLCIIDVLKMIKFVRMVQWLSTLYIVKFNNWYLGFVLELKSYSIYRELILKYNLLFSIFVSIYSKCARRKFFFPEMSLFRWGREGGK